jgi:hypothetical protein
MNPVGEKCLFLQWMAQPVDHPVEVSFHVYLIIGVVVTLPQRVIAAEGKVEFVKEEGERKLDLNFWLDKLKQPNNKASVRLLMAVNPTKDGTIIQGEMKFSHPALQKVTK